MIKEKSAFEPYHCYRPYIMDYHERGCRKYHDSHSDVHKYKMVSPKCDQCEYHDLKRKSSNSSLENIVLKLKKSRNDDKETRHFSPHVIEKMSESHYKSPPRINTCTRIENVTVDRSMHSIERGVSSVERRLSPVDRIERSMPSVERSMSSVERRLSPVDRIERNMSSVERSMSSVERRLSPVDRIERSISSVERRISPSKRGMPLVERSVCSLERRLSPIERSMSSVERISSVERRLSPVERSMPPIERSMSLVDRNRSSIERSMPFEQKLSPGERNSLERNSSYERIMTSTERSIHDIPRSIYSSEKYLDTYNSNRSSPDTVLSEINDSNEKSSFVTLLEQQDDIQYASTLSMASILGTNSIKKHDESVISGKNEKENPKCSSPIDVTSSSVKMNSSGDEKDLKLYNSDDKNDNSDKIAETKCDKCHKRFYRKSQLIRHISNHVVHECHKCNAFFYCVRKFKKHMSTHESYPCEFCEEEFYEASAWYHHRAKHTMVECSSCDMIFYNKTALLKHKFTHLQYICPVCRFPFSNLNHWISHRSCHKTFGSTLLTPLFSCRECSTTFPSQDTYMKHTCLHRQKKTRDTQRPIMSKRDISDLIGVDQTAK